MHVGRLVSGLLLAALAALLAGGCEAWTGPHKTGDFVLSSQTFGDNYYLFGYSYEDGKFYRFQYKGEPVPDIINEGYRVLVDGGVSVVPGFNTPGQVNGFALAGKFESLENARNFFDEYQTVRDGLQFETVSDTVELYQVWIQKTAAGNYVKLLVTDIQNYESESGNLYNEVSLTYSYQPDGSNTFPE